MQARREAQLGAEGLCFNESGCIPTTSISSATLADSLLASSRSSRITPTVEQTIVIHANDNAGFTDEAPQLVDLVAAALQQLQLT